MPSFAASRKSALRSARATASVAVTWNGDENLKTSAEKLARELALPFVTAAGADADFLLTLTPDRLELRHPGDPRLGPVYVDYTRLDLRPYGPNLSRRQPLAHAFGKKVRTIADATAGYAQDALLLALMGFRVTAIERSAVIASLARDGLRRFEAQTGTAFAHRLQLIVGDACALLPTSASPDAAYLDPMFPPKRRQSALARKEIRLLRELVGDDPDAHELFQIARRCARDRVVVKRPDEAPPLVPDPDFSLSGKLVRYDVYLAPRAAAHG